MTDKKTDTSNHYVDNKKFYAALCEWKVEYVEAIESGDEKPPLTNYIGGCFVMMAEGLAKRSSFSGYTFRDDMVGTQLQPREIKECFLLLYSDDVLCVPSADSEGEEAVVHQIQVARTNG